MHRTLLLTFLLLSACGTPQEQCINAVTRDMRVVDRLIAEAEGNLARGYAFENVTVLIPKWIDCTPEPTEALPEPPRRMCFDEIEQTTRRAVAIDLGAEQAKLAGLKAKRALQAKAAAPGVAKCKIDNPE